MNVYGKSVWDALTTPSTLNELVEATGFPARFVLAGIVNARCDGYAISAVPGQRRFDGDGEIAYVRYDPTIYTRGIAV